MVPDSLRAEVIHSHLQPRVIRCAMIDFDGTVSLLREGWDQVMIPMMVEELQSLPGTTETTEQLAGKVTDWVVKLNGQPTIKQMQALVDEVSIRRGTPQPAGVYKQRYLQRLSNMIEKRKQDVRNSGMPSRWTVPGTHHMLDQLKRRQLPLLLASGTDLDALREEAAILQVDHYFTEGIAGPESDTSTFTKAGSCDAMLSRLQAGGSSLLNIGDGYVETKVTKERGGLAIGVAYDHDHPGEYHGWRREQLIKAGVDLIVPDLQQSDLLLRWLLDESAA